MNVTARPSTSLLEYLTKTPNVNSVAKRAKEQKKEKEGGVFIVDARNTTYFESICPKFYPPRQGIF